jgi:hypothetical protein
MRPLVATPVRLSALIAGVLGVAAAAWYLGSPFFIRTTVQEAFPSSAAVQVGIEATSGAPGTAMPAAPRVIASGTLGRVDALHNGTGAVLLLRSGEGVVLRFDTVAITNAPDVHVYLSRETGGKWTEATSLYLGPLKATNGSFNYAVPQDTDVSVYRSVIVWCRQFSVLVTWADLR